MINTGTVLTAVQTRIHDNSTALRAKMLEWLNQTIATMAAERDWEFMKKTAARVVTANAILKPDDYARFRYAQTLATGLEFHLKEANRLTDEEAFEMTDPNAVDPAAQGFTESSTSIIFYPGTTADTVTLGYVCTVPEYADNAETILPDKFGNLLKRSVLSAYYEYDVDERAIPSMSLDQQELDRLKSEENRRKPIPKRSARGYLR